jgi:hypothetical protein
METDLAQRLARHPFFTPWRDPESDVVSYVLTERLASYQFALYFMSPSMTGGSEWLWFRCAEPPDFTKRLCAVKLDPENPAIRLFPNMPLSGNPWIAPDGETAFVPLRDRICRLHVSGEWEEVLRMPKALLNDRHLFLMVTNVSLSADGRYFLFDSHVGKEFIVWVHDRHTGEHRVVKRFDRKMHHSMFSLHDPDLLLVNQGPGRDVITGERIEIGSRTWLLNVDGSRCEELTPGLQFGKNARNCHEWWTAQGDIQYCEYGSGIWEVNPDSKTRKLVWPRPSIHGQCSPDGAWLVCDENTYNWSPEKPCSVRAFHRSSGQEIRICGPMPPPPFAWKDWRAWHPDPHPHFSADGQALMYTTSVYDTMNVALCPLEALCKNPG